MFKNDAKQLKRIGDNITTLRKNRSSVADYTHELENNRLLHKNGEIGRIIPASTREEIIKALDEARIRARKIDGRVTSQEDTNLYNMRGRASTIISMIDRLKTFKANKGVTSINLGVTFTSKDDRGIYISTTLKKLNSETMADMYNSLEEKIDEYLEDIYMRYKKLIKEGVDLPPLKSQK